MTRPLLSDRTIANLRALIPQGVLQAAEVHAIGGDTWTISRPATSDGVNAPGAATAPGDITAYVVSPKAASLAGTLAGTTIPTDTWRAYTDSDQDLRVQDTIVSVSVPSLKFLVQTRDEQIGFVLYQL